MKLKFTQISLIAILCLAFTNAQALQYVATTSGNYGSNSTWLNGNIPPDPIGANDVIINSGVTVTMDRNIVISSTFTVFQMKGNAKITSTTKNYMSITGGNFIGDVGCVIDVDSIYVGSGPSIQYFGSMTANTLAMSDAPFALTINLTVNKTLRLVAGTSQLSTGTLALATGTPRPVIVFAGGELLVGTGATFSLANPYDVRYEDANKAIGGGWELLGAGYTDIEIAVPTSSSANLTSNLNIKGNLKLTSGTLLLNSFDLVFGANSMIDASGTGSVSSSGGSDITINSTAANIGILRFDIPNNVIDNFTMNTGPSNGTLELATDLSVATKLDLQSGKINTKGNNLYIATGATISGGSSGSYVISETGGALRQEIAANATATYPVGHKNAYTPIKIESKNGSTYSEMGVNVAQGVNAHLTTGTDLSATQPLVDATWTINQPSTTGLDYAIEVMWEASAELNSFDRGKSYVSYYDAHDWDMLTPTAASNSGSMYSQKKDGISTLGSFAVFDENTVGINNIIKGNTIGLYPNPAKNILRIDLNSTAEATIYNVSGQAVNSASLNRNNNTINISSLPAGMYYVHLKGEDTNATGRFVKE